MSVISFWEMFIKIQLSKLTTKVSLDEIYRITEKLGIRVLDLQYHHISELEKLPLFHRDPFDRIITSQAIAENLTILTKDEKFQNYPVSTLW